MKAPPRLEDIFRELRLFERNRNSFEVKVFAVADYMEGLIYRATARKVTGFLDLISKSPRLVMRKAV